MKSRLTLIIIISIAFLWLPLKSVKAAEIVDSFETNIEINKDSSFKVTETINYDFGDGSSHGIYRKIPYSYSRNSAKYNIRMKVLSVTDENGNAWEYTTSRLGGELSIKIGNSNVYVTGKHQFNIIYEVQRAINYFSDHDELYWNVTGDKWEVPISSVVAQIFVPGSVNQSDFKMTCYTGAFGSAAQNCQNSVTGDNIDFNAVDLGAYENLSVVLGWPKGITNKPTSSQQVGWFLADNWPVFIPLFFLIIMFYLWYTRGRDPKGKGTIVPQYEPVDKITAGELGTVVDERVDLKDISATIIQLAVKGYLKIREVEEKKLFKNSKNYDLIKLKEADDKLLKFEKLVFNGIFDSKKSINISDLKNKFYVHLKDIKQSMYDLVVTDGYFPSDPESVRRIYLGISALILPIGFFIFIGFSNSLAGFSMIAIGMIAMIFSRAMPRRTKKGAEAHEHILGFKWFLSVTETERLKFHNAPDKSPKQFEEFLPYAMALGVENEWAKQFAGIYLTPPDWYEGRVGTAFGAWYLASSLGSFSTNMNQAMVASPRGTSTAGFGGSGFGGGGFSGGGFGGGGGGSW
ncbi:MAG: DUF2207 domain-containing protein [Patescibacteria group bacterium]|jgi:uncharacterized membrane protein